LRQVFFFLHDEGFIPEPWFARQVARIDRTDGDIDTLSKRLAYIRTWTYCAQRSGWVQNENHWRGETRAVEDRLSDALHARLTQRFVDRRTSVLLRRLKQKESLVADVNDKGEVTVEGELIGRLEGFRFRQDKTTTPEEEKAVRAASLAALAPEFHLRADRFYNAPDTEIDFTEQGGLMWGDQAVGKLVKGADPMKPGVQPFVDDEAGADVAQKVERRLQHFIDRKIAALFEPLLAMSRDEELTGLVRGFAFQIVEALGVLPRAAVAQDVKALDQDARGLLRKHGVRFGQFTIFLPVLLKPAPTRLRLVLSSLFKGRDVFPEAPPPGLVTIPAMDAIAQDVYLESGYRAAGARAIRIDMLERLADMLRAQDTRGGFEATADMLSITGMTLEQFADLMQGLGYAAEKAERTKVKPAETKPDEATQGEPANAPEEPLEEVGEAQSAEAPAKDTAEATPENAPGEEHLTEPEMVGTEPADAAPDPETEVFYTFRWAPKPRREGGHGNRPQGKGQGRPQGKGSGKPQGKGRKGGPKGGSRHDSPKTYQSRPDRKKDRIDPDNPFAAALMGLKDKT
ncbi:MAG: disulfide oxidoreductase, partial [Pseudomonadota bacterium]